MPARTDDVADPALADALLLMRRGQAYWARRLAELRDDDFDAPSLLPGWTRRHLVAHVGFSARALARLVEGARTGVETRMYASDTQRDDEIAFGATLPVEALRNLAAHAAIHLNVEWRDLPAEAWSREVRTAQGRIVPVSETVWMRTREVWVHAVDLAGGGRVADFPARLHDLLLDDLVAVWRRRRAAGERDLVLEPTDRPGSVRILAAGDPEAVDPLRVRGTAADLVGWGTGRSDRGVCTHTGGRAPRAPRWL